MLHNRKTILVTGAAGLLGSHMTRYLLDKGHTVIAVDDLSGGSLDYVPTQAKFYRYDMCDAHQMKSLFENNSIDYVYHFAAFAAEGLSHWIRNRIYTNITLGSINIINECIRHDVKKLVFASSMAVYGHQQPPFTEKMIPVPVDPYGIAKYTVEQDLAAAHDHFGFRYTIIRPHNIIGIQQNIWDKYRNVIGIWIRKVIAGEPITIYGDGTQTRAFSDVRFYMKPMYQVLFDGEDASLYNLGADRECTIEKAARTVKEVADVRGYSDVQVVYLEKRNEVQHAFCDHALAKEKLGFVDKTNLMSTISMMFSWAEEQEQKVVKRVDYEIDKSIYSYWK